MTPRSDGARQRRRPSMSQRPHRWGVSPTPFRIPFIAGCAKRRALRAGTTDLNTVVAYRKESLQIPPILLYDDVPGGAGLVAQLGKEPAMLRSCLELARERVQGSCGCGVLTSCYGCLRSYRNQFVHEQLRRGPVHAYLQQLLERWA